MGARVIKVEQPGKGDDTRAWGPPFLFPSAHRPGADAETGESAYFLSINRNKESVTLDFKQPEGRALLERLIAKADVLVENFRPGTLTKLGLDYASLSARFPRLIYCSISGFGHTGPRWKQPGYDAIMQAEGGLMSITGTADAPPVRLGVAIVDIVSGMFAAYGVSMALLARERTGKGQEVDMSLLEAGLSLMMSPVAQHFHVKGDWVAQTGRNDSNAPSGFFRCSDGSYLTVFASYPALWDRFVETMNLQHLATDPRFSTRDARTVNADALHEIIAKIYATKPTDYWVDVLVKAGIPASPVNTVGQMIADKQVVAREMIVEQVHPTAGRISVVGVPVKLSETPGSVRTPAPLLGEHTADILTALGYGDRLGALKTAGVI
jgi:crotonobetainyl-CoA:carnitine CoA-transferase CaiB-like acyl-CoA transferase